MSNEHENMNPNVLQEILDNLSDMTREHLLFQWGFRFKNASETVLNQGQIPSSKISPSLNEFACQEPHRDPTFGLLDFFSTLTQLKFSNSRCLDMNKLQLLGHLPLSNLEELIIENSVFIEPVDAIFQEPQTAFLSPNPSQNNQPSLQITNITNFKPVPAQTYQNSQFNALLEFLASCPVFNNLKLLNISLNCESLFPLLTGPNLFPKLASLEIRQLPHANNDRPFDVASLFLGGFRFSSLRTPSGTSSPTLSDSLSASLPAPIFPALKRLTLSARRFSALGFRPLPVYFSISSTLDPTSPTATATATDNNTSSPQSIPYSPPFSLDELNLAYDAFPAKFLLGTPLCRKLKRLSLVGHSSDSSLGIQLWLDQATKPSLDSIKQSLEAPTWLNFLQSPFISNLTTLEIDGANALSLTPPVIQALNQCQYLGNLRNLSINFLSEPSTIPSPSPSPSPIPGPPRISHQVNQSTTSNQSFQLNQSISNLIPILSNPHLPKLDSLNFFLCALLPCDFFYLASAPCLTQLKTLRIRHPKPPIHSQSDFSESLRALIESPTTLSHLTTLQLPLKLKVKSEGKDMITTLLTSPFLSNHLTSLSLTGPFDDSHAEILATQLIDSSNPRSGLKFGKLVSLTLCLESEIGIRGARSLSKLSNLTHLSLGSSSFCDQALKALFCSRFAMKELDPDQAGTNEDDPFDQNFASLYSSSLPNLVSLQLFSCPITDIGFKYLAKSPFLQQLTHLTILDKGHSTNDGVWTLVTSPHLFKPQCLQFRVQRHAEMWMKPRIQALPHLGQCELVLL